jgi:hypothetical protein
MDVNLEKIVSILIRLLEDQENAKITYRIVPPEEKSTKAKPG